MKALLLVAGTGSRLRPLTLERPKCMVEVAGRHMLETHLRVLASQGVRDVHLAAGYLAEILAPLGLPIIINHAFETSNMVRTLYCARQVLKGGCVLAYGDIVYPPEVLRTVMETAGDMVVAVDLDWEPYWRARFGLPLVDAETLRLENGCIVEIGQPPVSLDQIEGQFMGLLRISSAGAEALIALLEEGEARNDIAGRTFDKACTTDLLTECIRQGHVLKPAFVRGGWVEVDSLQDYELPLTRQRVEAILAALDASGT